MTLGYAAQLLQNTRFRCEEIRHHLKFGSPQLAHDTLIVALDDLGQIRLAIEGHEFPATRWKEPKDVKEVKIPKASAG